MSRVGYLQRPTRSAEQEITGLAAPNSTSGKNPGALNKMTGLTECHETFRNSNAHSYSRISKPCVDTGYQVCEAPDCDAANTGGSGQVLCDRFGCDYNPYRLGDKEFYGKGKTVDTGRKFT